jgi:transcriptional regulator with XRE-family HTH domain
MKNYIKNLFKGANEKTHSSILNWLNQPDYRAQLFVDDIISQIIGYLNKEGISYSNYANKVGKTRAAITQFLDSDAGISVKRLFEYTDALNLTIEHPKLVKKDFESIYQEIADNEFIISSTEMTKFEKKVDKSESLEIGESSLEAKTERKKINYPSNFYSRYRAS